MATESGSASVVVVGAGAAGLMAAIFAARAGRAVRVIESTAEGGKKILISGGGRCNVLPSQLALDRFVTDSSRHLMRALLRSWPLSHQRAFFEEDLRIPLALEAETGKLFPVSNRARDVRDGLVEHARSLGVGFDFNTVFTGLHRSESGWIVHTTRGLKPAGSVILATGGLSVPSTGSNGEGLRVAESLGHRINDVYPALTPLVVDPPVHASMAGLSLTVRLRVRAGNKWLETTGGFLFTHRGYSGPAVLDISHLPVRDPEAIVRVQWAPVPSKDWELWFLVGQQTQVSTTITEHLPRRLALQLMREADVPPDRVGSDLKRSERIAVIDRLTGYRLPVTGNEGFKKAEVTGGGVALDEVNPRTLESRRHRDLFLCGEMLDAFGPIGGHNFAWAWATGRLAGLGAAQSDG